MTYNPSGLASGPIASDFQRLHAARGERLEIARLCARLVKPRLLPAEGWTPDQRTPRNFQSTGSRGVGRLRGSMVSAYFGPPWMNTELAPEIMRSTQIPDLLKQDLADEYYRQDAVVLGLLESGRLVGNARPVGFKSAMSNVMDQILVVGDSLTHLTDDFGTKVFRFDQYVTERDSTTAILMHGVHECTDPLSLPEAQFAKTGLDYEALKKQNIAQRMVPIFTRYEWNPQTKVWTLCQEVNGKEIFTRDEKKRSFASVAFDLIAGENYGGSFVEQNLGDLDALDELNKRLLQNAELASRAHPIIDPGSSIRAEEMQTAEPGQIWYDRVSNGVPVNLGMWRIDKMNDMRFVLETVARLESNLNRAFLLISETAPTGDRVTATAWRQVIKEVDDALSGVSAMIADELQLPLAVRAYEIAKNKNLLGQPKPELAAIMRAMGEKFRTVIVTGEKTLLRQQKLQSVLTVAGVLQTLGPEAMARIDIGVLTDIVARYGALYDEPGLVKSRQQMMQEQAQAMRQQVQLAAQEQAVSSLGKIAEMGAQGAIQQSNPSPAVRMAG